MFAYVKTAASAMGGTVVDAFRMLETAKLYNISPSDKKYASSFETYLYSYSSPFVFVNPAANQSAKLTLAHEFGHFANDFACYGSNAGVDVAEFFSQGFEYLSLCYGEDTQYLTQLKMLDCLSIFVEQSAYAAFEHQVYALPAGEVTEETVSALFMQTCIDYGIDTSFYNPSDYVTIPHFFTNPLYIISYVVSNDAAFQLYQLEQAEPGSGLEMYEELLPRDGEAFLTFVETAGLESPFDEGRIKSIRNTLEKIL
jgi:oligoendopeptidase F